MKKESTNLKAIPLCLRRKGLHISYKNNLKILNLIILMVNIKKDQRHYLLICPNNFWSTVIQVIWKKYWELISRLVRKPYLRIEPPPLLACWVTRVGREGTACSTLSPHPYSPMSPRGWRPNSHSESGLHPLGLIRQWRWCHGGPFF